MTSPTRPKTTPKTPDDPPHWQRMQFKGNKVWVALDADQKPLVKNGKQLIKYQIDQPHEYWVQPSNLVPLDQEGTVPVGPQSRKKPRGGPRVTDDASAIPEGLCNNAICIYTDGACSGNPGPAGIGVVMHYKENQKEISRYLGIGTNNIAELEAIRTGLLAVKNRQLPVIVFTDSAYALGLLTKGWKAKQNQELVAEIRKLVSGFKQIRFVKVKGHSGHPENERADQLAVESLKGKSPL